MEITRRDGSFETVDKTRVYKAIKRAFLALNEWNESAETICANITDEVVFWDKISIEDIQDQVIELLKDYDCDKVAQEYSLYRKERAMIRQEKNQLIKNFSSKLLAKNVENQNANLDERSFGGRLGEATSIVAKDYALKYCMSDMARENHENNEIYIHDLDKFAVGMHNCISMPFDDLLAKGFTTRQTDVRPANSVNTAFQLVAVLFQLQSLQQFGGVAATHLDWTMVPYVRKSFYKHYQVGLKYLKKISTPVGNPNESIDSVIYESYPEVYEYAMDMTNKEVYQAVEGMYHNLNTLQSRSGNQLPFTSINYGTCTSLEGRMITKALLDISIKGIGKNKRTSIFPCGIFQCMRGVNRKPGDPNYDLYQLALQSTSQRLYPNYANVDWSGNAGYKLNDPRTYFSTMGCRTANGWDVNGFGQLKDGRGNICPVTIILPTLAAETVFNTAKKPDMSDSQHQLAIVDNFMELLDAKIAEARDMLIERFEWICSQPADCAKFMYENGVMAGYDGISTRSALKHGTLAMGQLGLAETLQLLIGEDHTNPKGMELAKRIESLFKTRCAEYKEKYKLNFGVYYTPAENLCYTAMKKFKAKYGTIPNVSDREYFTNSIHVPVWKEISAFKKFEIESQLTGFSSAGCITYAELPSTTKHNIQALDALISYGLDLDLPYIAINEPNDMCDDCGYTDEINDSCPICGGTSIKRLRRVTGYLTGDYKTAFNAGKIAEVEDRVKHAN